MTQTVRPINAHSAPHAVQQANFVFFPIVPLVLDDVIARLRVQREKDSLLQQRFAAVREIQGVAVRVGPKEAPTQTSGRAGYILEGFDPDGSPARQLHLLPDNIRFTTTKYTRWKKTWPDVESTLKLVMPPLEQAGVQFQAMLLQYEDAFEADFDQGGLWFSKLFRENSGLFAESLRTQKSSAWHNYLGFFEELPGAGRILTNINIVVQPKAPLDNRKGTVIHVSTSHRFDFAASEVLTMAAIRTHMDSLHQQNKNYMRRLLTDEMLVAIELNESDKGEAK